MGFSHPVGDSALPTAALLFSPSQVLLPLLSVTVCVCPSSRWGRVECKLACAPPAVACQSSLHVDHTHAPYSSVPLTQKFVSAERGFQGLGLGLVFGFG